VQIKNVVDIFRVLRAILYFSVGAEQVVNIGIVVNWKQLHSFSSKTTMNVTSNKSGRNTVRNIPHAPSSADTECCN
jgi:hypothetical protein